MEGTTKGGAILIIMDEEAIIHRWNAPTGAQRISFQAEKTAPQAAIAWLEEDIDLDSQKFMFLEANTVSPQSTTLLPSNSLPINVGNQCY